MDTISFGATQTLVDERDGAAQVLLLREGDLIGPVTVNYTTGDDTASAGADYTAGLTSVTFAAGEAQKLIRIPVANDALAEGSESFSIEITGVAGATLGFPRTTRVIIQDDEAPSNDTPPPDPAPSYFVSGTAVVTGLFQPTTFDWVPNRPELMVIAEKSGLIRTAKDGVLLDKPLLDLRPVVNDIQDRGLVDIELHPQFDVHPYLYAYYAVDPAGTAANPAGSNAGLDGAGNRYVHLVRYTVDTVAGELQVRPGSEVVLLGGAGKSLADISGSGTVDSTEVLEQAPSGIRADGSNVQNYIAADSLSHAGGDMEFGPDGALYVSVGDGTSFNFVDLRAERVQDIGNLSGKVLRIDPLTGAGLADNPFFVPGDANANQSKVFQLGIRNSFRMAFDAEGDLFLGEVGWYSWEEINTGKAGANFGWPYYEGGQNGANLRTVSYQNTPEAQAFYASGKTITAPFQAFSHVEFRPGFSLQAVVVGDVYTGNDYAAPLKGDLFFASLTSGQVFSIDTNEAAQAGATTDVKALGTQEAVIVSAAQGPDGKLWYTDIFNGIIGRWEFSDTPPVAVTPPPAGDITIGFGPDALVLKVSQDAYNGNAQYTVSVDGVQIGNVLTAQAAHGSGKSDTVTVLGEFINGQHTVSITFLNDSYDGPTQDRNLYLDSAAFNGVAVPDATLLLAQPGPKTFGFVAEAAAQPGVLTVGAGPDTLILKLSQDAYNGDAQYTVSVDGVQIGGVLTATALQGSRLSDTLTVRGDFAAGNHVATVTFLNDSYDGPTQDRNLYLDSATYNGTALPGAAFLLAQSGPVNFGFVDGAATPPPSTVGTVTVGAGPDALVLKVSQDAYKGNAQYTVSVDGVQVGGILTAQAAHDGGQPDTVTVRGDFAAGAHTAAVTFLNDAYDGPGLDRNLYLESATYNGAALPITPANVARTAPASFGFTEEAAAPPAPTPGAVTVGAGPDALVLKLSQEAYMGDAQYTVRVDGAQIGGVLTASALRGSGQFDTLTVRGDFAAGAHSAEINFLNDSYGGTADTDRNLYVDSGTYNGEAIAFTPKQLLSAGPAFIDFQEKGAAAPVAGAAVKVGAGSDALVLQLQQDAYKGSAQYTVSVDGAQVGGILTASATRGSGLFDTLTVQGEFAAGEHRVSINFLNDLYGGTVDTDRNLYVASGTYNGGAVPAAHVDLLSSGPMGFSFVEATA